MAFYEDPQIVRSNSKSKLGLDSITQESSSNIWSLEKTREILYEQMSKVTIASKRDS